MNGVTIVATENRNQHRRSIIGTICALCSTALFGAVVVVTKLALVHSVTRDTYQILRFGGCILCLWTIVLICKKTWKLSAKKVFSLCVVGVLIYTPYNYLLVYSASRIPASMFSLLLCIYPVYVVLVQCLMRKYRLTKTRVCSLAVCICGLYFLLDVVIGKMDGLGLLCGFLCSLFYAAYILTGSWARENVDPIVANAYMTTAAFIMLTVVGISVGQVSFNIEPIGWLYMVCLSTLGAALPFVLMWKSIEYIGPARTSILGMLEPISTSTLDMLVFGTILSFKQMIGAGLVLISVFMIQRARD